MGKNKRLSVNAGCHEITQSTADRLSSLETANGNRLDIPTVQDFFKIALSAEGKGSREQMHETIGRPDNLIKLTSSLLSDPDRLDSLDDYRHSLESIRNRFTSW